MHTLTSRTVALAAVLAFPPLAARAGAQAGTAADAGINAGVDSLFAGWATRTTPGCAVGAMRDDQLLLTRAYGMAELEHGTPNTVHTVFEAGSVSNCARRRWVPTSSAPPPRWCGFTGVRAATSDR